VTFETRLDDGALSLGGLDLEDSALVLTVNSERRCAAGRALLIKIFGERLGEPVLKTETVEQVMATRDSGMPNELDIPEEERCAIIHDFLDLHYRRVLDEPVPMLDGKSPRAAVKTKRGRTKVADWLKFMENQTAKSTENSAMASYSFAWLWTELGIEELRR